MAEETNTEATVEPVKLTPEQQEANRKKALDFYKKQTELLTAQAEYEKLMADIEQSRAKRMEMIIRQAQMANPPEAEDPENPGAPEGEKKERKLKTN